MRGDKHGQDGRMYGLRAMFWSFLVLGLLGGACCVLQVVYHEMTPWLYINAPLSLFCFVVCGMIIRECYFG